MKAAVCKTRIIPYRSRRGPAYPNAAEQRYRLEKVLDWALAAATSAGVVTALLALITLF